MKKQKTVPKHKYICSSIQNYIISFSILDSGFDFSILSFLLVMRQNVRQAKLEEKGSYYC